MMDISIRTIDHAMQRYDTCGDWTVGDKFDPKDPGVINIRVSAMPDWRYEFLVGLHELIEAALCRHAGISQEAVDAWDLAHPQSTEPGDERGAPYYEQHFKASYIEHHLCRWLEVDWIEYTTIIANLGGRDGNG